MSYRDYRKNKHCPVCNQPISNRATYCRHHIIFLKGKTKPDRPNQRHYSSGKKCVDCGIAITNSSKRCSRCVGIVRKTIFVPFQYSKNNVCAICGRNISNNATKCRSCSKKGQARFDMRGDKNHKWNGGYCDYYGSNWEYQRKKTLERDCRCCVICGKAHGQLNVHHQIPFNKCDNYLEANDLSNLVTLCTKCHIMAERQDCDIWFN